MNRPTAGTPAWLAAIAIATLSLPADAMPKAAEHENAPVTFAAEAAKPRIVSHTAKGTAAKAKTPARAPQQLAAKAKHRK